MGANGVKWGGNSPTRCVAMDEQRSPADRSLIQELINAKWAQLMRAVAEMMAQQGLGNAGGLRNLMSKSR
ncbi:hypothetical protein Oscil6304_3435 [Oscillatoria acuminata PCC 6304]|uniref:Uncharacterized protein n=2 Tax=Oscillatoria acuminata TaxID=118323 RepID=K9TLW6_9CYAN|nr:hypothetical protein Oscil6304_3435 [Oscillatoria acuminata PCC 6304]